MKTTVVKNDKIAIDIPTEDSYTNDSEQELKQYLNTKDWRKELGYD